MKRARRSKKRNVLSAGIVPVFLKAQPLYLLLRVYNYWDFPKGVVERDEDPFDGAIREFKEETTLEQIDFPWGNDFVETEPYSYGKVARYYLGRVNSLDVALTPNPVTNFTEHHEYRWMTYAMARPLLVPRVQRILDWAQRLCAPHASASQHVSDAQI